MTETTSPPDRLDVGDDPLAALRRMTDQLPFNDLVGVEVREVGDGRAAVALPADDRLTNHLSSVHAVAELAPAEPAGALAVVSALLDLVEQGYMPVVKHLSITYVKLARGELIARAVLPPEAAAAARAAAEAGERVAVDMTITVDDAEGRVAEVTGEYVLKQFAA